MKVKRKSIWVGHLFKIYRAILVRMVPGTLGHLFKIYRPILVRMVPGTLTL